VPTNVPGPHRLAVDHDSLFNPGMSNPSEWLEQSALTSPGHHARRLVALPDDIAGILAAIQGVLLHASWTAAYGLPDGAARHTLPVGERLDNILQRDPAPLDVARPPANRSTGSCRDFALMLCSALRSKAIPARIRCGFAAYFDRLWEDHWVCEYWQESTGRWRLADAQIDTMLRQRLAIAFDATDVPRSMFMTAGQAWLTCRSGDADPSAFGHGDATGLWFIGVNVVRDHLSLGGRETSDWDRWREASPAQRLLGDADLIMLDHLAGHPGETIACPSPAWLK
jgi:hypothetical protein